MALIKCPECGKDISDTAVACPNCGYPIARMNTAQQPQGQGNINPMAVPTSKPQGNTQMSGSSSAQQNAPKKELTPEEIEKRKEANKKFKKFAIFIIALWVLGVILNMINDSNDKKENNKQNEVAQETVIPQPTEIPTEQPTEKPKEKPKKEKVKKRKKKKVKVKKKKKLTKAQYMKQCKLYYHNKLYYSNTDLTGKKVKLRVYVGERFTYDIFSAPSFLRENDLQIDGYKCFVKRKNDTSYVSGGETDVYIPNKSKLKMKTGGYYNVYGEIFQYTVAKYDKYNEVLVKAKYIEQGVR